MAKAHGRVELVLRERIVGALELHGVDVMVEDETHAAGARWTLTADVKRISIPALARRAHVNEERPEHEREPDHD